jgi:hypothetical protein
VIPGRERHARHATHAAQLDVAAPQRRDIAGVKDAPLAGNRDLGLVGQQQVVVLRRRTLLDVLVAQLGEAGARRAALGLERLHEHGLEQNCKT